ncbi:hypothetical protein BDZ97DRAFT_2073017 [Flammula alnicola]|nr:hypothetical protein BDZ97DRAFT_2073017 [Flammula alnicola]
MTVPRDIFDQLLPEEIRLHIFRFATLKPSQADDTHMEYRPFEAVALHARDWPHSTQLSLNTKLAIVLVCKEWKNIATEILYECLRIHHDTHELLAALERRTDIVFGYGRWCCPMVNTLVRACTLPSGGCALRRARLPTGTTFPTFPSLKRIEWWLPGVAPYYAPTFDLFAGFLGDVLEHSPHVRYLTLSGKPTPRPLIQPMTPIIYKFASLTTLRLELEHDDPGFILETTAFSLPNLTNLILGGLYSAAKEILKAHGHQIKVLEFLDPIPFLHENIFSRFNSQALLGTCPSLQELSTTLCGGSVLKGWRSDTWQTSLKYLTCIRVKLDIETGGGIPSHIFGDYIRDNLDCPALERIELHGSSLAWKQNPFYPILEELMAQKRFSTLEIVES